MKKDIAIPGNLTIGVPVLLMIPQIQPQEELLQGMERDILHECHQYPLDLANHPTHVVLDLGCTRSTGIKRGNQKVPETYFVLRHYDRVLPL